ncbi:MAG: NAD(P)-dependent oxidoreductase [Pseudomonadota bacterium]
MLKFVGTPQNFPEVKPPELRRKDFEEIYNQFNTAQAAEQAARCSQCGIPFCQIHCPLQNNIPDWLKLTAEGRLEEAYAISSATNNFPEICGRICPQDKLCEGNCVIEKDFGSVTIGSVEKYITETAFENGWVKPISVKQESGFSVGIIGAGPAGLAAADMLRRKGHEVHIYDRYDRSGGLLIYGIPNFKLEKDIVLRRHKLLEAGGIKFHLGVDIGGKTPLDELQSRHDAILIATGVYKSRAMEIPNSNLENILPALTYLTASNRKGLGDVVTDFDNGKLNAEGKTVVVVGGGDTAMDCVRTAIRQGAKSVTCLYRRDQTNMPGSAREVKNAKEEGVNFQWLSAPKAFVGDKKLEQILVQRMRLSSHDVAGRQDIQPVPGETFSISADMVIEALGFDAENIPVMFNKPDLKIRKNGTLDINQSNFMTSVEGVFAAGDIVRGASLVVWAIKDGRDAAGAIHNHIMSQAKIRNVA